MGKKFIYKAIFYVNGNNYYAISGPRIVPGGCTEEITYYIAKQEYTKEFKDFYIHLDKVFYKNSWTRKKSDAKLDLKKMYSKHFGSTFKVILEKK